jgi:acetyl esterase/lipase
MMIRMIAGLTASLVAAPLMAQSMAPITAPAEPNAIPLDTGGVTGMPAESWFEGPRVRNVSKATLTPFLPEPSRATGAAVIVAPGGAFALLAIDKEGWTIARWLADHGVAAFVLKYRVRLTPADPAEAMRQREAMMRSTAEPDLSTPPQALEDGRAALRMVKARAAEWGVDPARVGMMGFSAGAMTTLSVALNAPASEMPAFIAPIYGPMVTVDVPASAPPMFAALAADDPLFASKGLGLIEAWQRAGKPVEFHLYQKGGHGYGIGAEGTTTLGWLEDFRRWLDTNGLLNPAK